MITPNQIREKKISTVETDGYDRNEVNELLVEIIESYEAVCAENKELYRKMEILASKIEEYREDEDSIKTAIISAQKTAHQVTKEANEKAEQTLSESNASAQKTVQEAKEKADKIIGEAREYVANLTQEKADAANKIIAEAEEKANSAISSAKLVAQDAIDKAKKLTEEMVSKAKNERAENEEIIAKLKDESRQFKTTLVSLYETQLNKLKNLSQSEDTDSVEELESELDAVISSIGEISSVEIDTEPEEAPAEETAEPEEVEEVITLTEEPLEEKEEATAEDTAEEIEEIEEIEEVDEIDEIISEIESAEPLFEPVDDEEEMPTKEEIASALNAFTENEITPVEGTGATIPVIDEEPVFESAMPFESFFDISKGHMNTDETISLTSPDEDEDEDDSTSKFRGFFKKKK